MSSSTIKYFSLARTGLLIGLKALGLKAGDKILVPDFLCEAAFQPMRTLSLEIIRYKLRNSLQPRWSTLELLIIKKRVKNLFVVHFFGQPIDMERIELLKNQYNLKIIEDNSHGYSGKLNKKLLGTFGDIGISSPRKILGYPFGGVLYTNLGFKLNLSSLSEPKNTLVQSTINFMKMNMNSLPMVKNKIKSIKNRSNVWSDPRFFKEEVHIDSLLDKYSFKKIMDQNWFKIRLQRKESWIKWSKFILDNNLRLVFNKIHEDSCPWALPVYAKNLKDRNYWLNWGVKNGVDVFPWPTLIQEEINIKGPALKRWEKMLCFPLNIIPNC